MNNSSVTPILSVSEIKTFYEYICSLGASPTFEDVALILPYITQKKIKKGEVFLKVGDTSQEYYFNTKGIARSFHQFPNGVEKTYFILTENNIFVDYASLILQTPATENYEALEDMEVYCISYEGFINLSQKYHIWETIGRNISDHSFYFMQKRLRSMMNDDAATKYTKFKKYYEKIAHRIPQNVVASYLGITPQSLSRLKKEMDVL
jgi:CRP/FNR family transcriptional regulator, anaerobic regulatory protein